MPEEPTEAQVERALEAAQCGDTEPVGELFQTFRPRLERMIALRTDPRAQGRFDPADVLQEAFVEATERLATFARDRPMPFFLWVRFLAGQKLLQFHRSHLGAQARDAGREISISQRSGVGASSVFVAGAWLEESTTPSRAAVRDEEHESVRAALEAMSATDREVLVLRHFEQLSNVEIATVLEISTKAASARYVRALTKIQAALAGR